MKDNYYFISVHEFKESLKDIITKAQDNPHLKVCLEIASTKDLDEKFIEILSRAFPNNNFFIRVAGGYTKERIANYPNSNLRDMHTYDNIYTLSEASKIMTAITRIENNLQANWSPEEKFIYFIHYLKNNIIYHPFHETEESKEIRSLRGLYSGRTVCAGYALIFKELCDRNGIPCQYVEGACNKEDSAKGYLTHAWNIVTLNGYYIPVDLTWIATENFKGHYLSFEDIANVNEFVKSHIPGKHEKIQDYRQELRSIDGNYLKKLNNMINRNFDYSISDFDTFTRKDGSKFILNQVGERIHKNKPLYKYVITEIDENHPPQILDQKIFFSNANIRKIKSSILRRLKLKKQLEEARQNKDDNKFCKIHDDLRGGEWLFNVPSYIADVLFSKKNMAAAISRGDYYLGEIKKVKKSDGSCQFSRVVIDPNYGQDINCHQKIFTRSLSSGGGTFVVEQLPDITTDVISPFTSRPYKLHRYNLYELCLNNFSENVLRKDSLFTDPQTDLLTDERPAIADVFLSRHRIDRKQKETAGYLGYLAPDGTKTYNHIINDYFLKRIHTSFKLTAKKITPYYKPITFIEMKRLVTIFKIVNGQVLNRLNNQEVQDSDVILRCKFAYIWLKAAGLKTVVGETIPGYEFAFVIPGAEELYNAIFESISTSLRNNGYIKSIEILDEIEKNSDYKQCSQIVANLFQNKENLDIIDKLFRLQDPSALGHPGNYEALNSNSTFQLSRYRQQLEQLKHELLEVVPTANGKDVNIRKVS